MFHNPTRTATYISQENAYDMEFRNTMFLRLTEHWNSLTFTKPLRILAENIHRKIKFRSLQEMDNSQRIQILISNNHSAKMLNIYESFSDLGTSPLAVYYYNLVPYPNHMPYNIIPPLYLHERPVTIYFSCLTSEFLPSQLNLQS